MNSIYYNTTNYGTRSLIFQSISVLFVIFSVLILNGCQQKTSLNDCVTYEGTAPYYAKNDTSIITALDVKVQIINPYKNYPYFYKGQVHCHSNRGREDGTISVKQLLEQYRDYGYHFVCVTEHDRRKKGGIGGILGQTESTPCKLLFEDPGVADILYIPGEEGGKGNRTHFLELGLSRENPCRPSGDFELKSRIYWVENQGGVAVAPHIDAEGHVWVDEELFDYTWLRGLELRNDNNIAVWDRLLSADKTRWGFCVDDAHQREYIDYAGGGHLVVNSTANQPEKVDIINNIRNGNFYAVLRGGGYNRQKPNPQFQEISAGASGDITVRFNGCHTIRFRGRNGTLLKEQGGFDENNFGQFYSSAYTCNGSEGYVRLELLDSQGTISYSQPLFVYGNSNEACISINYEKAEVISQTTYWIIYDGAIVAVFDDEQTARKTLAIIKHYKVDRRCSIGGARWPAPFRPSMKYFTVNGQAPSGAYPGEESVAFDPNNLQVKFVTFPKPPIRSWKIIEGNNIFSLPRLDFKDSEIQAHRGLEIIKKYGFTHLCFVGGTNEVMYFRR